MKLNECESKIVTKVSQSDALSFEAYVDGAASGNPGPGGWGSVVAQLGHWYQELGGSEPHTTNNRMEMIAAIEALHWIEARTKEIAVQERLPQAGARCVIWSDSTYVLKGITEWIRGWKARGWKNAQKQPVANVDLWEKLDEARHRVEKLLGASIHWKYVKGHSGHPGNDRADAIAATRAQRAGVSLFAGEWGQMKSAKGIWPND